MITETSKATSVPHCLVGAGGFEPPASASRTLRSTRLSHAPFTKPFYQESCLSSIGAWVATAVKLSKDHTSIFPSAIRPKVYSPPLAGFARERANAMRSFQYDRDMNKSNHKE